MIDAVVVVIVEPLTANVGVGDEQLPTTVHPFAGGVRHVAVALASVVPVVDHEKLTSVPGSAHVRAANQPAAANAPINLAFFMFHLSADTPSIAPTPRHPHRRSVYRLFARSPRPVAL